ncbi:hypothetical protein QF046_003482 [Microbacterium sp. W4I4]|uniref:hypothetical protein n=1 Tax=Microbacterium sp. W4I4 TaxID=3042295 RepID=UPI00277F00E5|nr:hypothetical protein [Microbacterium sp. W4I4]MDQ0615841.1 hypothetical protein [Microbacterium sp. W4I4]
MTFLLDDAHDITTVTLNGHDIDIIPGTHLELPTLKPGVLGAVRGANELVITDAAGNPTTRTFALT